MDPLNERYKDTNTIYERNLGVWLWLWLPFYVLIHLSKQVIARIKANRTQKSS